MAIPQVIRKPMRSVYRRVMADVLVARVGATTLDTDLIKRAREMQALSRECFCWTTPHPTRWWEYPWILREVERRMEGVPLKAIDAGAGKSPMPVALKRLGFETAVVDPNAQEEVGVHAGGEWDWTDYGKWGVKSIRAGMEEEKFEAGSLGVVVSVSVIEHVPADVRRAGLKAMSKSMASGGVMVLTIDLCVGTRKLWNRILDQEVESLDVHGTAEDIISEARAEGLHLEHQELCPISTDKHDILGLVFVKE